MIESKRAGGSVDMLAVIKATRRDSGARRRRCPAFNDLPVDAGNTWRAER